MKTSTGPAATPLLSVRSLSVEFNVPGGRFKAVDGVGFDVHAGRTLAIVGESGSGKSVISQAIMRLTDYSGGRITQGQVLFQSPSGGALDRTTAGDDTLRRIRGNEIAMIFQEPMTSLNPVFTIGNQIAEALILHQGMTVAQARAQTLVRCTRCACPTPGAWQTATRMRYPAACASA